MTDTRDDFALTLLEAGFDTLNRTEIHVLQLNLGKVCNQMCAHCHVDAGPTRTESMTESVAQGCLRFLKEAPGIQTLDLTGGAPELNPNLRLLVSEGRALGRNVIARCNLTVLLEPGLEDLADFYACHQVEITASLPCYLEQNVVMQRGYGVFEKSIRVLRLLNAIGYGTGNPELRLNLAYNPIGAVLPPLQEQLEVEYKRELKSRYGILFDRLYSITNMPIQRFARALRAAGKLDAYMSALVRAFNPASVCNVMCRTMINVGYDGRLFDCDFNQMLDMPLLGSSDLPLDIRTASLEDVLQRAVLTGRHCFGCTAGHGSSCIGKLV